MLARVVCMVGEVAAEVFYEPDRFTRKGALPQTTLRLLQDEGSVAVLDSESHRERKRMFMSLMTPASRERLADATEAQWREHLAKWEAMDEVVLHDEAREIMCRAVCGWAGVPLAEFEVEQRTREFAAMIEGAGTFGPRNWVGLLLRRRTEAWIQGLVEQVRAGELEVPGESAIHVIAWHRGPDGELLEPEVATVELLNVLRPTVAVAWYVTFVALALHEHPGCREKLRAGEDHYDELFVQEVRRFYPFFPFVGAACGMSSNGGPPLRRRGVGASRPVRHQPRRPHMG
jgi:fatty-acid peroxygenase